ncbi:MAG TPA: hypothetical protein VMU59_09895 [Caulobacteraceae bacterium]|nr:hypothetical protein [Caulobacteraceae bacterium]
MFPFWLYATYVAFPLFALVACVIVRPYFQGWKHQDRWTCVAGSIFAMLAPAITQPPERLPVMLTSVALAGLLTYGGLVYLDS